MEGKASHGAGHKLCADGFFEALKPFFGLTGQKLPRCETANQRCGGGKETAVMEECFWESLTVIRAAVEKNRSMVDALCGKIVDARNRLNDRHRKPRDNAPSVEAIFDVAAKTKGTIPQELVLTPGKTTTLRAEMGRVLQYYNKASHGAILTAAADLLGSTSVNLAGQGFPEGYYNAATNPGARLMTVGGICEDAISGVLSGLSSYGHHIGVGSSYGAFIAPLGHITMRLHAIGNQARQQLAERPYRPMILVCAHAGLKTGEDGPTHADPQALQLLQENFPKGTMITLTPWDPQELWPLVSAALSKRPAIIAPFVSTQSNVVIAKFGLPSNPCGHWSHHFRSEEIGWVLYSGQQVGYAVEETLP
jgi:transketolase